MKPNFAAPPLQLDKCFYYASSMIIDTHSMKKKKSKFEEKKLCIIWNANRLIKSCNSDVVCCDCPDELWEFLFSRI